LLLKNMSQTLKLANYPAANIVEESELNADAAVGLALTLKDNQGFLSGDFIVIGQRGSETAELRVVDTPNSNLTGLTITAATKLAHSRFDQVTKLFGNKMKIYRAANSDGTQPADGSFSVVDTIDIDPDQTSTEYTDSSGSSSYWYKRTFYNATTLSETPLAAAIAYRGGEVYYATPEDVRRKAGLENNKWISDEKVIEKIRAAMAVIDGTLTGLYTVPFTAPFQPIINEITQLLAAGYLLTQEATNSTSRAQGEALIAQATNQQNTGWLDKLNTRDIKMVGLNGSVESSSTNGTGYNGWPNATTATAPANQGGQAPRGFRVSDRY
jgi:phage gp36-like protein